jgi:hypothetical protein
MIQGVPGMPGDGGLAGLAGERQGWDAAAASFRGSRALTGADGATAILKLPL